MVKGEKRQVRRGEGKKASTQQQRKGKEVKRSTPHAEREEMGEEGRREERVEQASTQQQRKGREVRDQPLMTREKERE